MVLPPGERMLPLAFGFPSAERLFQIVGIIGIWYFYVGLLLTL
jgi:hypothetical protein